MLELGIDNGLVQHFISLAAHVMARPLHLAECTCTRLMASQVAACLVCFVSFFPCDAGETFSIVIPIPVWTISGLLTADPRRFKLTTPLHFWLNGKRPLMSYESACSFDYHAGMANSGSEIKASLPPLSISK